MNIGHHKAAKWSRLPGSTTWHASIPGAECTLVWLDTERRWSCLVTLDGSDAMPTVVRIVATQDEEAEARHHAGKVMRSLRLALRRANPELAEEARHPRTLRRSGRPEGAPNYVHKRVGTLEVAGSSTRARTHCGIVVLMSGATDHPDAVTCGRCKILATGGNKGSWTSRRSGAKLSRGGEL